MKAAFLGLGSMGRGMARNLLKAGHEVVVFNRTRSKADELGKEGAKVAPSPAAIGADIAITMVADDAALEQIAFGPEGLVANLPKGAIHISMSTISAALSKRLTQMHREHGQVLVAAPVFGRPEAAEAAKLFIVAAGPAAAVERCRPLFDAMGQKTFTVGEEPVMANVTKLAGNFMIASVIECLGEAFSLGRKYGLAADSMLDVFTNSLFAAPVYRTYGGIIAQQKWEPAGFRLRLGLKDVRLALAAADAEAVPMPVASFIHDSFLSAVARGMGEQDWAALARLAAERAGLD
ncbi:MAG TPA: NAD(P)-dependent oxidoreductase [Terriglobales bacterium]|jgi:3-hydroxyisobutyrate dehydrogenase-like beta-hydroxyacid dehydrogenase|nr:NAD(P)-dependent oxidoreductase [Terriglobales bacterium]